MSINFLARMPDFPADVEAQVNWINQLKAYLTQLDDKINETRIRTVLLEQATQPTRANWEVAYVAQTGEALVDGRIPPSTQLLWFDTARGVFAGEFSTLSHSDGETYLKNNRYGAGNVAALATQFLTTSPNITYSMGAILSDYPVVSLTLPVNGRFNIRYYGVVSYTSGAGTIGLDFLINGNPVGETYFSVASGRGLVETEITTPFVLDFETPEFEAGDYTIQSIIGRTTGTPTFAVEAFRQLTVLGIAQ